MRERYTLKLKSGHTVKIRKNEAYEFKFDDIEFTFEEHPAGVNMGVHTHVWIEVIDDPDTTIDIYEYVLWDLARYPRRIKAQCLLTGWELDDEEEFEGPVVLYELLIRRKFSQTLINDIKRWALELYDIVSGYVAMRSLFGDKVEF